MVVETALVYRFWSLVFALPGDQKRNKDGQRAEDDLRLPGMRTPVGNEMIPQSCIGMVKLYRINDLECVLC